MSLDPFAHNHQKDFTGNPTRTYQALEPIFELFGVLRSTIFRFRFVSGTVLAGCPRFCKLKGHRLRAIGLGSGYLVTSGYALSSIGFSTAVQSQSKFRYLGEEEVDSRETCVLGFVQRPGKSTFLTTMSLNESAAMGVLTQGVLWVDKNSFQIIRMRTDLLAQRNGIRLDQLTAVVTFFEMHLQDIGKPLWLPSDVDVCLTIDNQKFRTIQHYTNYRRYRVSVEIGTPQ